MVDSFYVLLGTHFFLIHLEQIELPGHADQQQCVLAQRLAGVGTEKQGDGYAVVDGVQKFHALLPAGGDAHVLDPPADAVEPVVLDQVVAGGL